MIHRKLKVKVGEKQIEIEEDAPSSDEKPVTDAES